MRLVKHAFFLVKLLCYTVYLSIKQDKLFFPQLVQTVKMRRIFCASKRMVFYPQKKKQVVLQEGQVVGPIPQQQNVCTSKKGTLFDCLSLKKGTLFDCLSLKKGTLFDCLSLKEGTLFVPQRGRLFVSQK